MSAWGHGVHGVMKSRVIEEGRFMAGTGEYRSIEEFEVFERLEQ